MMSTSSIERHDTDILILGTGGAGMFAALHAQQSAAPGTKITIAVKGLIGKCGCTRMVQGGYNVALGGGDTVERHFMDTINGGKWLPNQDMAWKLCEQAVCASRRWFGFANWKMRSVVFLIVIPMVRCIKRHLPARQPTELFTRVI